MTTYRQDQDFLDSVISDTLLEDAIEWIQSNMHPEDVFSDDQLTDWALDNDFVEAE